MTRRFARDIRHPTGHVGLHEPTFCGIPAHGRDVRGGSESRHPTGDGRGPVVRDATGPPTAPPASVTITVDNFTFAPKDATIPAGTYNYFCGNHGAKDGTGMAGRIVVIAR